MRYSHQLYLGFVAMAVAAAGCGRGSEGPADGSVPRNTIRVGDQELYLAPSSESAARAAALLPTKPSEDASSVLGKLKLPEPDPVPENEREYLPSEGVEWVVTAQFAGKPRLLPDRVGEAFDRKWREEFDVAYGQF